MAWLPHSPARLSSRMSAKLQASTRTVGWYGIHRGHRARPFEGLIEKLILGVSMSAIAMVFFIFVSVTIQAWPLIVGSPTVDSRLVKEVLPAAELDRLKPEELRSYLGLDARKFATMDRESLQTLMEIREEAAREIPEEFRRDPDATINTATWRYLMLPHQWSGYEKPEYIWQPIGRIHKYNIVPLLIGSLKTTLIGLALAVPVALAAALYVSQLASARAREWLKPGIELLSGIPSVVIGTFALLVLASVLQAIFGYPVRLNAFVAGVALSIAVIPVVFTIAEDALTSVPRSYLQAALAVGATQWQAALHVIVPAALPGLFASVVLGFGRAVGETMIVLLVCSASVMSWNIFDSARNITTTIAAEMAEAVAGGHHYRVLFLLGTLLFLVTFATNFIGDAVIHRMKRRLEGRA